MHHRIMHKLHPKAVWLFLSQSLFGYIFLFLILGFFYFVMSGNLAATFSNTDINMLHIVNIFMLGFIILIFVSLIPSFIIAHLTYENWKYELTEAAVKIEKGIIWKKYISIPYERIQNVDIHRGVFARILGLSDLQIQTAGYSGYVQTEGRLPGLDQVLAEKLRDELIKKLKNPTKQGL